MTGLIGIFLALFFLALAVPVVLANLDWLREHWRALATGVLVVGALAGAVYLGSLVRDQVHCEVTR